MQPHHGISGFILCMTRYFISPLKIKAKLAVNRMFKNLDHEFLEIFSQNTLQDLNLTMFDLNYSIIYTLVNRYLFYLNYKRNDLIFRSLLLFTVH